MQCIRPSYGIIACVVYYEPHPTAKHISDIDGVTAYDDFTAERVAVVSFLRL